MVPAFVALKHLHQDDYWTTLSVVAFEDRWLITWVDRGKRTWISRMVVGSNGDWVQNWCMPA